MLRYFGTTLTNKSCERKEIVQRMPVTIRSRIVRSPLFYLKTWRFKTFITINAPSFTDVEIGDLWSEKNVD